MEYRKFDNVIIARIDKGEEILEQLKAIAINENINSSAIVSGAMGGLRPAVIGMIGAAVVSVGQTVFLPEGLAAVTAYPLVCSLAIFALMAVLTHKKLHPIVIILLSALLGIVTGYLQPA